MKNDEFKPWFKTDGIYGFLVIILVYKTLFKLNWTTYTNNTNNRLNKLGKK